MKRQGCPDDIGAAVTYLASDEANFVTGQKLAVNGGNQTRTAKQLRIGSATLYRKLKRWGLIGGQRRDQA